MRCVSGGGKRTFPPLCDLTCRSSISINPHENLDSAKEFQCGPRKKIWIFFRHVLGGRGALKQLSEGKTESKLNIFCSGLIQRVSAMLPISLPQTEYTNGHFIDNMHRFDTFLMFSTTLRLRIIDFTMFEHVGTYVRTSGQSWDIMSQCWDKVGTLCPNIGTKLGHYVPMSGQSWDICPNVGT